MLKVVEEWVLSRVFQAEGARYIDDLDPPLQQRGSRGHRILGGSCQNHRVAPFGEITAPVEILVPQSPSRAGYSKSLGDRRALPAIARHETQLDMRMGGQYPGGLDARVSRRSHQPDRAIMHLLHTYAMASRMAIE